MAINNSINLPKTSIALNGANANITSMTGLTGSLKAPTAVLDANGNNVLKFTSVGAAINYVDIGNSAAGGPGISAVGSDSNIDLNVSALGTSSVQCFTPTGTFPLLLRPNSGTNTFVARFSVPTITATRTYTLSDLSGTVPLGALSSGITAHAGGGQANAVILVATINIVTIVGTAGDSIKLPTTQIAGMPYYIRNGAAANSLNLYPPSGAQINALGVDAPLAIAAGTSVILIPFSATQAYTYSVA